MRVIFCGSRDWKDRAPIEAALVRLASKHREMLVIHGGARGADAIADALARGMGIRVKPELADWVGRPAYLAGHERNERMLNLSPALWHSKTTSCRA